MAIDSTMTTAVSRVVSSLLGHTAFRSSDTVSCKKVTGLTRPTVLGEMGGWLRRLDTLAVSPLPHFSVDLMPPASGAILA